MPSLLFDISTTIDIEYKKSNPLYPAAICQDCFESNYELNRRPRAEEYTCNLNVPCPLCGYSEDNRPMFFLRTFNCPTLTVNVDELIQLFATTRAAAGATSWSGTFPYHHDKSSFITTVFLICHLLDDEYLKIHNNTRGLVLQHILTSPDPSLDDSHASPNSVASDNYRIQLGVIQALDAAENAGAPRNSSNFVAESNVVSMERRRRLDAWRVAEHARQNRFQPVAPGTPGGPRA